ncbi:MAG: tRNA (adenosine(37)-N6)-threonylcarbamoyltransferase complex transferase subunit TsaD [Bauldia litoralis]
MTVLGIESSCDETAAALVRRGADGRPEVLSERLLSQIEEHRPYEGVVPGIAARSHLVHLDPLIAEVVAEGGVGFGDIDAIAATGGPGLIGGVMVGVTMAKAIAAVHGKPFIAVNHLEGHALSGRLGEPIAFPYLLLLVSGGHCQLLVVRGVGDYRQIGTTIDDAAGEAFDKVAKLLNLGYPGGPAVEAAARDATAPERFSLPRPMKGRPDCDFSFSGLKTAVRHVVAGLGDGLTRADAADVAAAFQLAVAEAIEDRCRRALGLLKEEGVPVSAFVVAGGVAANTLLRSRMEALAGADDLRFIAPPLRYCTDNAAMIAWAGAERLALGATDPLDFAPRPRWPLATLSPIAAA